MNVNRRIERLESSFQTESSDDLVTITLDGEAVLVRSDVPEKAMKIYGSEQGSVGEA